MECYMNAKKCKAIRKAIRAEVKANGWVLPPNGLLYRNTRKVIGFSFPKGWLKDQFLRLAICGGPWLEEAKKLAVPQYARQAINTPKSFRHIYRAAKSVA